VVVVGGAASRTLGVEVREERVDLQCVCVCVCARACVSICSRPRAVERTGHGGLWAQLADEGGGEKRVDTE
jgi:hypothetical protein